jgi:hypothetical protein
MTHIEDTRWAEVSRGFGSRLVEAEGQHLAACPDCSARLEEETRLSALLAAVPQAEPSENFLVGALRGFDRAVASRRRRRVWFFLGAYLLGLPGTILGLLMLWGSMGPLRALGALGVALGKIVTLLDVLFKISVHLPLLPIMWSCACFMILAVSSEMLFSLARKTASSKYPAGLVRTRS